jgi:hypothetical protein
MPVSSLVAICPVVLATLTHQHVPSMLNLRLPQLKQWMPHQGAGGVVRDLPGPLRRTRRLRPRDAASAVAPQCVENLLWGGRVVGVRVLLARASPSLVKRLLWQAWARKAPKRLVKGLT